MLEGSDTVRTAVNVGVIQEVVEEEVGTAAVGTVVQVRGALAMQTVPFSQTIKEFGLETVFSSFPFSVIQEQLFPQQTLAVTLVQQESIPTRWDLCVLIRVGQDILVICLLVHVPLVQQVNFHL